MTTPNSPETETEQTKPINNAQLTEAITNYRTQGLAVVPFYLDTDGKKKPDVTTWSQWKTQPQTDTEFETAKKRILQTRMFGVVTGTKIIREGEELYLCIVDRDIKDTALSEETKAKSLEAIKKMPTTRTINTRSGGQHLEYLSRTPVKGKKLNEIGLELLAFPNLCVMYPSTGYTLQNDNLPTIVENAEALFLNAIEATGLIKAPTTDKPEIQKKPIRPCFEKLMRKPHLAHMQKVALIYELHHCGRTDSEIYEVFHDNKAWEPNPEHTYNEEVTDTQIKYTLEKAKAGAGVYRYNKPHLEEDGICHKECPHYKDADCRKTTANKKINPIADVAKPIEQKFRFVTEKLEKGLMLYVYNPAEGIYTHDVEHIIKREICTICDDETREKLYPEVLNWINNNPRTPQVTFNKNPELIAVNNGILNVLTRELKPFSPDYLITNKIPHNYNPNAKKDSLTVKFFTQIMSEEHSKQHQEFMGKTLYRKRMEPYVAAILVGEGSNGKSVQIDVDTFLLGKNNIANQTFQNIVFDKYATANLKDKLGNFCADMPSNALKHMGDIKMIITADAITSQFKYGHPFDWTPIISLQFSCNKAPEIDTSEDNTGTFRRFLIWQYPYTFSPDNEEHKEDKQLRDKLLTEEEAEAYLNHCLDGLDRLLKQGEYTARTSVPATRKLYIEKSNSAQAFTDNYIEVTDNPDDWFFTDDAYRAYITFCHTKKLPTKTKAQFSKTMEQHCNGAERYKQRPPHQPKGTPLSAWRYVKIKNQPEPTTEKQEPEKESAKSSDLKQVTLENSVPSVPTVPPLAITYTDLNQGITKNIEVVGNSGTVGTAGTKNPNANIFPNRFCGSDCGSFGKPQCPLFTNKIPADTPLPCRCYGYRAPPPSEPDNQLNHVGEEGF